MHGDERSILLSFFSLQHSALGLILQLLRQPLRLYKKNQKFEYDFCAFQKNFIEQHFYSLDNLKYETK